MFKAGLAVEVLLAFFRGQEAVIHLPYWFVPQGHTRQLIPEVNVPQFSVEQPSKRFRWIWPIS